MLLHQYQVSPFAAKVRRALRYKGLSFEVQNYAAADAGKIRRSISPTGKTPVLEDERGLTVDSTTILHYLEQHYPQRPILPAQPALRAQAHIIEDWADESLFFYDLAMRAWPNNIDYLTRDVLSHDTGFARWLLARLIPGHIRKTGQLQGIGRKDHATICGEVATHFDALLDLLRDSEWLVGDHLTVADIGVASMLTVLERAEEAAELMQQRSALLEWKERVDAATFPPHTAAELRAIT